VRDILEVARRIVARQRLRCRQRRTITREHVADLTLGDRHQRHHVHAVLERHQQMPAAAQQFGLKARLCVQRDQPRFHRSVRTP
jgi:hypothetical protein